MNSHKSCKISTYWCDKRLSEDSELERLKAKRLAEMQKNISTKEKIESAAETTTKTTTETISEKPRDSLIKVLGFRGLEVLENAE